MVKLTPELINSSMQFINPCRDRELDLRGKCIAIDSYITQFENNVTKTNIKHTTQLQAFD